MPLSFTTFSDDEDGGGDLGEIVATATIVPAVAVTSAAASSPPLAMSPAPSVKGTPRTTAESQQASVAAAGSPRVTRDKGGGGANGGSPGLSKRFAGLFGRQKPVSL